MLSKSSHRHISFFFLATMQPVVVTSGAALQSRGQPHAFCVCVCVPERLTVDDETGEADDQSLEGGHQGADKLLGDS